MGWHKYFFLTNFNFIPRWFFLVNVCKPKIFSIFPPVFFGVIPSLFSAKEFPPPSYVLGQAGFTNSNLIWTYISLEAIFSSISSQFSKFQKWWPFYPRNIFQAVKNLFFFGYDNFRCLESIFGSIVWICLCWLPCRSHTPSSSQSERSAWPQWRQTVFASKKCSTHFFIRQFCRSCPRVISLPPPSRWPVYLTSAILGIDPCFVRFDLPPSFWRNWFCQIISHLILESNMCLVLSYFFWVPILLCEYFFLRQQSPRHFATRD